MKVSKAEFELALNNIWPESKRLLEDGTSLPHAVEVSAERLFTYGIPDGHWGEALLVREYLKELWESGWVKFDVKEEVVENDTEAQ